MHRAYRLAFVFVAILAVGSAEIGFCQKPEPATTQQDRDLAELRETATDHSHSIDVLTGRVDGMSDSMNAAAKASEAAARSAERVVDLVRIGGTVLTIAIAVLAFLGIRHVRQLTRRLTGEINAVRDEAKKHLNEARKCEERASAAAVEVEKTATAAQEYTTRIGAFAAEAEAKARELQSIQMGTELPPETKQVLEDISRKLELVEALGFPLDAEACLARGSAFYAKGEYQHALDCCDRAIALKPGYAEAHYNRGVVLGELGRYEDELAAYDRAIALKPDFAEAHDNRGCALGKLGRWQEALAAHDRAIELKPDYANAYYNRAIVHFALDSKEEAFADLRKAIEHDPKLRDTAKTDEDFATMRDDQEFRKLVGLDGV